MVLDPEHVAKFRSKMKLLLKLMPPIISALLCMHASFFLELKNSVVPVSIMIIM